MKPQIKMKQIVIIGGGMVGAACAVGLAKLGYQIQLIEKSPPPHYQIKNPYDLRISAISQASVELLQQLGAWPFVQQGRMFPYSELEVSEYHGESTSFSSELFQLPQLGFMLENNLIQWALWQTFQYYPNLQVNSNCQIKNMQYHDKHWFIHLDNNEEIKTPWVIAADGTNSQTRALSGIGVTGWQYRQECLLVLIKTQKTLPPITWQQFFPSGPRALLPLCDQYACLVWYDDPIKIKQLKSLTKEELSLQIKKSFPSRFSQFEIQNLASFPLKRQHAQQYVKNGMILIGDAAHSIHPMAGQGVNLGFKDVKRLIQVFSQIQKNRQDITTEILIKNYQQKRRYDNLCMQSAMDICYKGFKEDILPLKILRNTVLMATDKIQPLKKIVLKYALGF